MITERSIAVLIFDDVHLIDVAGPAEAFNEVKEFSPFQYRIRYFSVNNEPVHASCGIKLSPDIEYRHVGQCDDLLITGGVGINKLLHHHSLLKLISAWASGQNNHRLISVCSGALLLAKAGVLEGKMATTHWRRIQYAKELGDNIKWNTECIFTENENVFCSAGITTGIDLALHIIGIDCGRSVAIKVAQELIVPLQRSGTQSQNSLLLEAHEISSERLQPLIREILSNPTFNWTLENMSDLVFLTPRTLCRHMKKDMNTSPLKFVERVRLHYAVNLIENGGDIGAVAIKAGFGSLQRFNRVMQRHYGLSAKDFWRRMT